MGLHRDGYTFIGFAGMAKRYRTKPIPDGVTVDLLVREYVEDVVRKELPLCEGREQALAVRALPELYRKYPIDDFVLKHHGYRSLSFRPSRSPGKLDFEFRDAVDALRRIFSEYVTSTRAGRYSCVPDDHNP